MDIDTTILLLQPKLLQRTLSLDTKPPDSHYRLT